MSSIPHTNMAATTPGSDDVKEKTKVREKLSAAFQNKSTLNNRTTNGKIELECSNPVLLYLTIYKMMGVIILLYSITINRLQNLSCFLLKPLYIKNIKSYRYLLLVQS